MHYVLPQILKMEGFARLRYQHALTHAPDPADSEAVWRNSKRVTDAAGGRSTPHLHAYLDGARWKKHPSMGLWALQSGGVLWGHNGAPMTTPPLSASTAGLHETLKQDMLGGAPSPRRCQLRSRDCR